MRSNWSDLRALATITGDTLDGYGYDEFGGPVDGVTCTRCAAGGLATGGANG